MPVHAEQAEARAEAGGERLMALEPEQRLAIAASLEANAGNVKRTAREHGVDPKTVRQIKAEAERGELRGGEEIPPLKEALTLSYLDKARRTREALLDRMLTLAESEMDLFKVSGAFKIVAEAASEEEVNSALASRIRNAQAPAPAGTETPRSARSPDPALN